MTRDIPIIFSAPMIMALLREAKEPGTGKQMTRRLAWRSEEMPEGATFPSRWKKPSPWQRVEPGDRLWVRETVRAEELPDGSDGVRYAADKTWLSIENSQQAADYWGHLFNYRKKRGAPVPPIHMPRWCSRLTLTLTGVTIERLQDISEQDCEREGIERVITGLRSHDHRYRVYGVENTVTSYPRYSFKSLWTSLHGSTAWDENPEVVAISFRVFAQNIDALKVAA